MFVGYQRVAVGNAVVNLAGVLVVPAGTARVQLQSDLLNVRYTMDGVTNPNAGYGMLLINGLAPEWYELADLQRMRAISVGALSGLNVHYYAPSPLSV